MICRARLSHSWGSVGGSRLRAIDDLSLTQGRADHQVRRIAIALDLFRRDDHDIDRRTRAVQVTINGPGEASAMELASLDDQKIDITVGSHLAARRRPEQNDLLRLGHLDDAPDDVPKDFWSYRTSLSLLHRCTS